MFPIGYFRDRVHGRRIPTGRVLAKVDFGEVGAVNLPMIHAASGLTKKQVVATALEMSKEGAIRLGPSTGSLNNWRMKPEFALPGDADLAAADGGGAPLDIVQKQSAEKSLADSPLYVRKNLGGPFKEENHPRADDGKFGSSGGKPKDAAPDHVESWASRASKLPAKAYAAAKGKVRGHYDKLSERYGKNTARAIITAGILAFPLPGGTILGPAPIIAAAELLRYFRGTGKSMTKSQDLSEEEIERLGKEFVKAIMEGEESPDEEKKSLGIPSPLKRG